MLNIIGTLQALDNMTDEEKTQLYLKHFSNVEGQKILVDLMDRFCEFKPAITPFDAGGQAVIIYIKNRLLGIAEREALPIQGDE